jgi:manganese-dependent inorganic pyrophosphatase
MVGSERDDTWDAATTYVIGHQRPDMDAIGSAIGKAWLMQNLASDHVVPARAGQVGSQARFALDRFEVASPRLLANVSPTFSHVAFRQEPVDAESPLSDALLRMASGERIIPVIRKGGKLLGGLGSLALARAYAHLARHLEGTSVPNCERLVETMPTYQARDHILDHRNALLRSEGDDFLIVNSADKYFGTVTRRQVLNPPKAKLVLVDHNEITQAVPGAEEAEIVAVVDHHRLGNAMTSSPIPFIVEPVGSTCTLISEACQWHPYRLPRGVAGVMLSGILSDTLVFKSPTTTDRDRNVAQWLANIAQVDQNAYGRELIESSPGLSDRSAADILDTDRKSYEMAARNVSIAQIEVTDLNEIPSRRQDLLEALRDRLEKEQLGFICLMITDVISLKSHLLCQADIVTLGQLPFPRVDDHEYELGGMVSRKKQLVPALQSVLEEI